MGIAERMWDGMARVIKMDAKIEGLAGTVKEQQARIEDLAGRIIRLETALEIAMAANARIEKHS